MNDNQKNSVVSDAIRLMTVINSHLSEPNCLHSIKQIATEAFSHDQCDLKNGYGAFVATRDADTDSKSLTKQRFK